MSGPSSKPPPHPSPASRERERVPRFIGVTRNARHPLSREAGEGEGGGADAAREASEDLLSFSFPPVAREDARALILGSLPGQASLKAQQYYVQPQNAFWPLMGELFGAGRDLPYAERLQRLQENRIALWDVCASACRPGSLDSDIDHDSVAPNDFAALFRRCPRIKLVCFNGATAARLYHKLVTPTLKAEIATLRLPSTSPAHASRSFAQKREAWAAALRSPRVEVL